MKCPIPRHELHEELAYESTSSTNMCCNVYIVNVLLSSLAATIHTSIQLKLSKLTDIVSGKTNKAHMVERND